MAAAGRGEAWDICDFQKLPSSFAIPFSLIPLLPFTRNPSPPILLSPCNPSPPCNPSSGVRPFGVSLLIAGFDEVAGPSLYQVDPSGSYWAWKASAIGKNMINAKTFLEKRYNDDIELEDAVHTAILTLKEGFEGQMTESSIEIGIIGQATVGIQGANHTERPLFRRLSPSEVKDYLANIA
ncbi:proteasome subunit alpha type-2-like protein [Jimgerdemannia flammicorona]|uniref:Proteasome subunit alpha type-2-like protein n=1 Tax=Jimgerdemannia flammicorona TaxID=994334 RepID=A0A433D6Y5_9FUNG|nr:proteasome subunit alpha type-2-like protein [Jimgerdemannia flammicorona]